MIFPIVRELQVVEIGIEKPFVLCAIDIMYVNKCNSFFTHIQNLNGHGSSNSLGVTFIILAGFKKSTLASFQERNW